MLPKFSYSNSISVAFFFPPIEYVLHNQIYRSVQSRDCLNLLSNAPGYKNPKLFESLNNLHSLNIGPVHDETLG